MSEKKKIFVSYSRADSEYVSKLAESLRDAGQEVWMDNKIRTGQTWDQTVEHNIRECDVLLVVMSNASVSSQNVMDEVSYAIGLNKIISPILIEDCEIPMRLARYQYVDFTQLGMETGTAKLVADLNFEGETFIPPPPKAKAGKRIKAKKKSPNKTLLYAGIGVLAVVAILFFTGVIELEDTSDDFPDSGVELAANEEEAWKSAQKANTLKSYLDYIAKYSPDGKYLDDANSKSNELANTQGVVQYSEDSDGVKENYFVIYKGGLEDERRTPEAGYHIISLMENEVQVESEDGQMTSYIIDENEIANVINVQESGGKVFCLVSFQAHNK